MHIYFFDENKRYIGSKDSDIILPNATTVAVNLTDGQEAYFLNGTWEVKQIPPEPQPIPPEPTLEERNRADIDYIAIMTGVDLNV
jgi:hypothetical protein